MNRESLHRESAPKQARQVSTFEDLEVSQVAREFRKAMYHALQEQGWRVRQLLDGYIRYLRQQTNSATPRVKEDDLSYLDDADDSRFSM